MPAVAASLQGTASPCLSMKTLQIFDAAAAFGTPGRWSTDKQLIVTSEPRLPTACREERLVAVPPGFRSSGSRKQRWTLSSATWKCTTSWALGSLAWSDSCGMCQPGACTPSRWVNEHLKPESECMKDLSSSPRSLSRELSREPTTCCFRSCQQVASIHNSCFVASIAIV